MQRSALLVTALALSMGASAPAQPASRCTRETLNVRGTPVTAEYCITGMAHASPGHDLPVTFVETYSTPRGSFKRDGSLRFIAGEESSRVIEDVALDRLGLTGTLHLTLVLNAGLIRIEGAMLTPGAVTVK